MRARLRAAGAALAAAMLLAGCASRLSAPEHVRLGTDLTTTTLTQELLAAYETAHPGTTTTLLSASRTEALEALEADELDAVLLAIPPERDEMFHTPIARMPFVLVAHPGVSAGSLPSREVRALFSGQAVHWPGDGPPVQVVTQEPGTTSRLALEQMVLGAQIVTPLARVGADDAHAVELVGALPGAVSMVPLSAATDSVQSLAVDGSTPAAANGYPFVAYVEYIAVEEPEGSQRAFLEWLLSADGQRALGDHALPLRRADR